MAKPLRRALTAHLESSEDEDDANNVLQRASSDVCDVKTHGSNRASLLSKQLRDSASFPLARVSEAHSDRGQAGDVADSQRHDTQLRGSDVTTGAPSSIHLHQRAAPYPVDLPAGGSSTGPITTAVPSQTEETGSCASRGVDIVPSQRVGPSRAHDRSSPLGLAKGSRGDEWEAEAGYRKCSSLPEHRSIKGLPDYLSLGNALSNPPRAAGTSLSSTSRSAPVGAVAATTTIACTTTGDARGITLTLPGLPIPLPDRTAMVHRGQGTAAAEARPGLEESPPTLRPGDAAPQPAAACPGTSLSLSLSRGGSLSASGSLQQLAGPSLETLLKQVLASASLLTSMDVEQQQQPPQMAVNAASLARLCSEEGDAGAQLPRGATAAAVAASAGAAAALPGSRRPVQTATHSQPGTGDHTPHGNHMVSLAGLLSSAAAGVFANGHAADAPGATQAECQSRGASPSGPHPLMHSPWSWSGGERLDLLAAAAATVAAAGGEAELSYDPVPLVAAVADPVAAVEEFERHGVMEGTVRGGWPRRAMSLPLGGLLLTAAAQPSPAAASVGASGPPSFDASSTDMALSMSSVAGSLGPLSRAVSGALPAAAGRSMYGSGGSGSGVGGGAGSAGAGGSQRGDWPLSPPRMALPPLLQRRSGVAC